MSPLSSLRAFSKRGLVLATNLGTMGTQRLQQRFQRAIVSVAVPSDGGTACTRERVELICFAGLVSGQVFQFLYPWAYTLLIQALQGLTDFLRSIYLAHVLLQVSKNKADLFDLGITLDLLLNGSKYVVIDRGVGSGRFGHC
jgi:hypothetical protein